MSLAEPKFPSCSAVRATAVAHIPAGGATRMAPPARPSPLPQAIDAQNLQTRQCNQHAHASFSRLIHPMRECNTGIFKRWGVVSAAGLC